MSKASELADKGEELMAKQSRWPVSFNADDEETFAHIFEELRRLEKQIKEHKDKPAILAMTEEWKTMEARIEKLTESAEIFRDFGQFTHLHRTSHLKQVATARKILSKDNDE